MRKINSRTRRILLLILILEAVLFAILYSADIKTKLPAFTAKAVVWTRKPVVKKPTVPDEIIKRYTFDNADALKGWEEKIFKGRTAYKIIQEGKSSYLQASSIDSSSGLYTKIGLLPTPDLFISWRWRAKTFPTKKEPQKLANRREDDFAARIYVIFPGSNFFNSNVIEYLWDNNLPANTLSSSPFSQRVKLFVIRSGNASSENDGWVSEERNVYEDYKEIFKKEPTRELGAIALMSDSDNTQTASASDFDDLTLKLKKETP